MGKPYFHMFRHTGLLIKGFIWTFIFIMLLSLSGLGQKWREFKIKARRNSWAVEHRNQFPVPPAESDEEDEDTSWLPNIMYGVPCWYEDTTTKPWMNVLEDPKLWVKIEFENLRHLEIYHSETLLFWILHSKESHYSVYKTVPHQMLFSRFH